MSNLNKMNVDLVIESRWMIPVVPRNHLLEHAAVAIHQGKIVEVAAIETISANYQASKTVRLDEHVLIPGLINLHTHVGMTMMRGLADDLPLMQWLQQQGCPPYMVGQ
mgnify:CR=1 FL=1